MEEVGRPPKTTRRGLSTRRYPTGLEPVGAAVTESATATSRSAVSRRFVKMTETALGDAQDSQCPRSPARTVEGPGRAADAGRVPGRFGAGRPGATERAGTRARQDPPPSAFCAANLQQWPNVDSAAACQGDQSGQDVVFMFAVQSVIPHHVYPAIDQSSTPSAANGGDHSRCHPVLARRLSPDCVPVTVTVPSAARSARRSSRTRDDVAVQVCGAVRGNAARCRDFGSRARVGFGVARRLMDLREAQVGAGL